MTPEELADLYLNQGVEPVERLSDPSWRHGTRETWVFEKEGRFWSADFRLSTDGETHELLDGLATVREVFPRRVVETVYGVKPPQLPPWFELVNVWVDGQPKAQPRGRAVVTKGKGGPKARIFTPNTAEAFRGDILRVLEPLRPSEPIQSACRLDLDLYFRRPKRLCRKKDPDGPIRYDSAPDVDNVYKAVADALETMSWYDNDKRVSDTCIRSFYHSKKGRPGVRIRVMVEHGSRAHVLSTMVN